MPSTFEGHTFSSFIDGCRREWKVPDLWEAAADLPVRELYPHDLPEFENLLGLEVERCWGVRDETGKPVHGFPFSKLIQDVKRMLEADLSCPVILGPDGRVMDGMHRLIIAHIRGVAVNVVQFTRWP